MTSVEWLAWIALMIAGLGTGAVVTLSNWRVAREVRKLTRAYRRQKALELEQLQAQALDRRRRELGQVLEEEGGWRMVLDQLLADALSGGGAKVAPEGVLDLSTSPSPRFTVAGAEGRSYLFTTSPEELRRVGLVRRQRERVIPLDAGLVPAARVEVQAVWEHLARERLGDQAPVLPRQAAWFLVVREAGR